MVVMILQQKTWMEESVIKKERHIMTIQDVTSLGHEDSGSYCERLVATAICDIAANVL